MYRIAYNHTMCGILEPMATPLIERIRKLRETRKITQADMAAHLEISRLTYIGIESGEKKPTLEELEKIGSALGITAQDLIFPVQRSTGENKNLMKYRQMSLACIHFGGSATDGKITKTKLAKLLYLVDFSWYVNQSLSMSGLEYRALPRGPVANEFFQMTDDMFESGQINIEAKGAAFMISITEESSLNELSQEEIQHIKAVCSKWQSADTQTLVEFTHNQSPWMQTKPGMTISYELANHIPANQLF